MLDKQGLSILDDSFVIMKECLSFYWRSNFSFYPIVFDGNLNRIAEDRTGMKLLVSRAYIVAVLIYGDERTE